MAKCPKSKTLQPSNWALMLYRPGTTQPAAAVGPAGLQLIGSKPGMDLQALAHQSCSETSLESLVDKHPLI